MNKKQMNKSVEKNIFGSQKTCIAILPWTRTAAILMSKQIQIQLQ
jgi:hypothetical protein